MAHVKQAAALISTKKIAKHQVLQGTSNCNMLQVVNDVLVWHYTGDKPTHVLLASVFLVRHKMGCCEPCHAGYRMQNKSSRMTTVGDAPETAGQLHSPHGAEPFACCFGPPLSAGQCACGHRSAADPCPVYNRHSE